MESGYEVIVKPFKNTLKEHSYLRRRGIKGYILPDELKIYVNRNIGINDRVITLIHELLHELFPLWTENRVEQECKKVFKGLNVSQLGFLQFFVTTPREAQAMLRQHQAHSPIC